MVLPILDKIPNHPDEHQFYFNAFRIMEGKELHNYLHVALVEYALAGFLTVVNLFTTSGVNFPQGDPSLVTFYYGKIFGFILYLLTFILAGIILQRGEKKIKLRTVIFAILYFGSLGIFERFLRVNSDSMMVFVFLNFVIWSFWLHKQKASVLKFFFLNLFFIFLGTFTNLKSLFLMLPLAFLNLISPFVWYENAKNNQSLRLPKLYRFIFYALGIIFWGVFLWVVFIPRPFNARIFWYGIKKTIVHGTKFDFDYPAVSFGSWKVYIYDLFVEYLGLSALLAIIILFALAYKFKGKDLFRQLLSKTRSQIKLIYLQKGRLDKMTELVLLVSLIAYYLGVSSAVVHWSRWGVPLGILAMMILGTIVEKIVEFIWPYKDKIRPKLVILLPSLFLLAWVLRISLTIDLLGASFFSSIPFRQTHYDVEKFLKKEGISPEEGLKKAAWFIDRYSNNIGVISLEQLADPQNSEIEYVFWPYWNIGLLYTKKNVDLSTHNQRAFVDKYGEKIYYRFPSILAHYIHYTEYFAWEYLGLTWWPAINSLVEDHYGVVKLKEPIKNIKLVYEVPFKDMSHYYFPYSLIFNIKNLPDGYMFPPCYAYLDTKYVKDGTKVEPPPEIGIGAQTAGLYCHSVRFRFLFKGAYKMRIEGLPADPDGIQKVYSNLNFDWEPETKAITIDVPQTFITGEFGVATEEPNIKNLKFIIFYKSSIRTDG